MKRGPITIRGITYASRASAATILGVSVRTIHTAAHAGRLDTVGLGHRPKAPEYVPVRIRGVTYPSVQAAAKALKVRPCTISNAITRGTLETVGLGRGRRANGNHRGGRRARPVIIGPLSFPSRRAASVALGFSPPYLARVLNHPTPAKRERLMAAVLDYAARQDGHKGRIPETITEDERAARGAAMIAAWGRRRANEGARAAA